MDKNPSKKKSVLHILVFTSILSFWLLKNAEYLPVYDKSHEIFRNFTEQKNFLRVQFRENPDPCLKWKLNEDFDCVLTCDVKKSGDCFKGENNFSLFLVHFQF